MWVTGSSPSFILGYFYTAGDIYPVHILNMVHVSVLFQHALYCLNIPRANPTSQQPPKGECLSIQHFGKHRSEWQPGARGIFIIQSHQSPPPSFTLVEGKTSPMCMTAVPELIAFCHCIAGISTSYPSIRLAPEQVVFRAGATKFRCSTLGQQFHVVLKYCLVSFRKEERYL